MNLIKSLAKSILATGQLKELDSKQNDDSCNKERKAQDMEDEGIMYGPLLDDIDARDVNEDDFEIDMGWHNELPGVKQKDPVLKDEQNLVAQE